MFSQKFELRHPLSLLLSGDLVPSMGLETIGEDGAHLLDVPYVI